MTGIEPCEGSLKLEEGLADGLVDMITQSLGVSHTLTKTRIPWTGLERESTGGEKKREASWGSCLKEEGREGAEQRGCSFHGGVCRALIPCLYCYCCELHDNTSRIHF